MSEIGGRLYWPYPHWTLGQNVQPWGGKNVLLQSAIPVVANTAMAFIKKGTRSPGLADAVATSSSGGPGGGGSGTSYRGKGRPSSRLAVDTHYSRTRTLTKRKRKRKNNTSDRPVKVTRKLVRQIEMLAAETKVVDYHLGGQLAAVPNPQAGHQISTQPMLFQQVATNSTAVDRADCYAFPLVKPGDLEHQRDGNQIILNSLFARFTVQIQPRLESAAHDASESTAPDISKTFTGGYRVILVRWKMRTGADGPAIGSDTQDSPLDGASADAAGLDMMVAHPNFRGSNVQILFDQTFDAGVTQVTTEESTSNTVEWTGRVMQHTFNFSKLVKGKRVLYPENVTATTSLDSTNTAGTLGLYIVGHGNFIYQKPYVTGIMRLTYKDP